jgi:hypothetical protein
MNKIELIEALQDEEPESMVQGTFGSLFYLHKCLAILNIHLLHLRLFKAYVLWSIVIGLTLLGGILWLILK